VLLPYLTDTLRIVPAATAVIVFAPKAWAGRADRLRRNRAARGMAPVNAPLELAPPALREQPWWPSSTSSPDPLDNRLQPRRAPSSLTCIGEAAMRPHKTRRGGAHCDFDHDVDRSDRRSSRRRSRGRDLRSLRLSLRTERPARPSLLSQAFLRRTLSLGSLSLRPLSLSFAAPPVPIGIRALCAGR
jgi:hypothetical protein